MRFAAICFLAILAMPLPSLTATDSSKEVNNRKIAYDYARCVVRKHHDKAKELVLSIASNKDINDSAAQIMDPDCFISVAGDQGAQMRFHNDTYLYILADALVNVDFANSGETTFANRFPLAQLAIIEPEREAIFLKKAKNDRQRSKIEESIALFNAFASMSRYGECVVRRDPVNARLWLLTPPDTPEEVSRIKAMQVSFESCLDNGTIRFLRFLIRGTVAVNYYRLAQATVMPDPRSTH